MSYKVNVEFGRLTIGTVYCVREVLIQGSVTKASLRLGVTQPAVSQHIGRFEKHTGIQVFISDRGSTKVNSSLKEVIFSLANAQDDLSHLINQRKSGKLRLGMCECLSTALSVGSQLSSLLKEFELYIAKPVIISELFEKKEIDLFVKPLFHTEHETDLYADVSINWVSSLGWDYIDTDKSEISIMTSTQLSPYDYYIDQQLKHTKFNHKIIARIDDPVRRIMAASKNNSITFIPGFLSDPYKGIVKGISIIDSVKKIRYGLQYNKKRASYKLALSVFDKIEPVLEGSPLFDTTSKDI